MDFRLGCNLPSGVVNGGELMLIVVERVHHAAAGVF